MILWISKLLHWWIPWLLNWHAWLSIHWCCLHGISLWRSIYLHMLLWMSLLLMDSGLGETLIFHDLFFYIFNTNNCPFLFLAFIADENARTEAANKNNPNDRWCCTNWAQFFLFRIGLANLSVILPSSNLKCLLFQIDLANWLVDCCSIHYSGLSNNWKWDWSDTLGAASTSTIRIDGAFHAIR